MPPLPPLDQAVLIRVATSPSRPAARQELRTVLRQALAAWSNLSPEQLPLDETARGPVWPGQLDGHSLDISLSYADDEGWIGLLRGGQIGVDAMKIQPFAEAEAVARLCLGQTDLETIRQSADPTLAFAAAWTKLEARVKCLKRDLDEWSPATATAQCATQSIVLSNRRVVTVATRATARNVSDTFAPAPILFLDTARAKNSPSLA